MGISEIMLKEKATDYFKVQSSYLQRRTTDNHEIPVINVGVLAKNMSPVPRNVKRKC
jgi:hypothetical protein